MIGEMLELYAQRPEFFLELVAQHFELSAAAIFMAAVLGVGLGVLISQHKRLSAFVLGCSNVLYTIPSIALLGFFIPITGIGSTTAIIALTAYALLPMIRNTHTGLTSTPANEVEAGLGMGCTRWQLLWKIRFPLALPVIMTGFRTMVVMVFSMAGIAAFIGAGGLGVAIYRGITSNWPAMTFAGSCLIAVLAITIDLLLGAAAKKIQKRFAA